MIKRKRSRVKLIDSLSIKEDFDRKSQGGENVGLNIEFSPIHGYLKTMDSLYVHTIGLHQKGYPEIVIYLGPRKMENPIPEEDAVSLSKNVLVSLSKVDQLIALVKTSPWSFTLQGDSPRRFMRVPIDEESKQAFYDGKLLKLSTYYQYDSYDFILYEPSPWIH